MPPSGAVGSRLARRPRRLCRDLASALQAASAGRGRLGEQVAGGSKLRPAALGCVNPVPQFPEAGISPYVAGRACGMKRRGWIHLQNGRRLRSSVQSADCPYPSRRVFECLNMVET